MSNVSDEDIKNHILFKLHWKKKWGASHTALENLKKGVPKHLGGRYLDIGKKLIKEGYLLSKPTNYGLQVSLNPRMRGEIIRRTRKFFK